MTVLSFFSLLGRGGRSNHHIGNTRFREVIRRNRDRYTALPKHEKIKLSRAIVDLVHESGGRFLEPSRDGTHYVVASYKRAVEKTSQCLREKRSDGQSHHKSVSASAMAIASKQQRDMVPVSTTSKAA